MPRVKSFDLTDTLKKVMKIFWKKGYHATSMDDIVQETNVNRASLYASYGDKHTLYCESLKLYGRDHSILDFQYNLETESALSAIEKFMHSLLRSCSSAEGKNGCFMVNTMVELKSSDPKVKKILLDNQIQSIKPLVTLLQKGQEEGSIKKDKTATEYAEFIAHQILGIRVVSSFEANKAYVQNIIDITLRTLKTDTDPVSFF